jgi:hypothetical protein
MSDADRATGVGLADGGRSSGPGDAEAVFEAMQARLDELLRTPIVRNDAMARSLLDDMARAGAMDDVMMLLDQLDVRVRLLLGRKGRAALPAGQHRERKPRTLLRL